jgi:hypothetical protein
MRKLLLASVAALGATAGLANTASAQTVIYTENPQTAQPAPQLFERKTAFPGVGTYAPPIAKQSTPEPAPGQMIVRLQGLINVYQQYTQQGDATTPGSGTTGGNKLNNYDFYSYARLYPSLEGRATNGLKYGAFAEIRQDLNNGAGGGTYGSISGDNARRGELYWRRTYGYFGTDQLGIVRVGSGDQPTSLFITGNFENFDAGGWNGDVESDMAPGLVVAWPFPDVGSLYTTEKVVYLSPQFAGFDFGLSFEPNTGNVSTNSGCGVFPYYNSGATSPTGGSGATAGCNALSSTSAVAELARRKNTFDGVLRYRGVFGPVGVAATGGFIYSGQVRDSNTVDPTGTVHYQGLSVGDFGATVTWGGLMVGGHVDFGAFNPFTSFAKLLPSGEPDGLAYVVGASYQPSSSFIIGTHYLSDWGAGNQTQFNKATVGELHEQGVAVGATYSITPGFSVFLSSLWGSRKESGFNLIQNSASSTGAVGSGLNALDHNKTNVFAAAIGESFHW